MKERPIIFNSEMVKAILEGKKTQTRRPVKGIPSGDHYGKDIMDWPLSGFYQEEGRFWLDVQTDVDDNSHEEIRCPYGKPGDRLWVRESGVWTDLERGEGPFYAATDDIEHMKRDIKPSIHMPRWASRITLEITGLRVERVQDINTIDAKQEGIREVQRSSGTGLEIGSYPEQFSILWDSIYSKRPYAWNKNPWVWVIEFRRAV